MSSQRNSRRSSRGHPPAAPSRRWSSVSQPLGKASYRPMTSNMSRRPSRQQRPAAGQDSISEAEENVPVQWTTSKGTPTQKRYSYREPTDPKVASEMAVLAKYMKDQNLMACMMACCQAVLERDSLPYNPYPEFESKIRQEAERFHMFSKTGKAIQGELTSKLVPSTTPHIYGVKGYSGAWGLESVIHAVSAKALKQYDWLIEDVWPTKIVLSDEQQEYSGQILVALVGPAAFAGTMYPEAPSVDLRMEYVVYGPDLQTALLIFNNCISEDIRLHISSDTPHRLLGVLVPGSRPPGEVAAASGEGFWTVQEARAQWDDFWDAVRDAVTGKQPIVVQYVFLLDKENNVHRAGSKQFILHFVETSEKTTKEKFTSFAPLPYQTLYEGLFTRKAHADTYVTTLNRLQESAAQSGARPAQAGRHGQGMEDISLVSVQEEAEDDGIDDRVYADAVRGPIRESWQRWIAALHPVRDAFKLAHLTFLLALSDRGEESGEVKTELYRFLRSTAATFHMATGLYSTLQLLVATASSESDEDRQYLTHWLSECERKLLAVLDGKLHARSSEFHVAHAVLAKLVGRLSDRNDPTSGRKPLNQHALQRVLDYCTTLQLLLTEDAMSFFKHLNFKTLVIGCKEAFSKTTAKTTEAGKKKPTKSTKSNTSVTSPAVGSIKTNHGAESKEITQQKNIVIDVEEVKSLSNWPHIMVKEAVLMQYLVDVKLDLVWHEYLLELLTGDHLPPNPFPRLVTVLRQAAHRMQLCSETDAALATKLLRPDQARLVDRTHSVYAVASLAVYGLSHRTLAGFDADPRAFVKVAKMMDPLANREVVARRGQFQIEVSQAVGQTGAFYGRLVPYLTTLHLYDHYYIRGSIGADSDAIQLYAKLVFEYVSRLSTKQDYVILGFYFNGSDCRMSEDDLETDKATFISNVVDAARKKQDVYLKIYRQIHSGWRYLCLHKHFVLHYLYVDNTDDRHVCYSPEDLSSAYQYVFLSQEEAAAHSRGGGSKQLGNLEGAPRMRSVSDYLTQQIEGALEGHRVTQAYELVLHRALINRDPKGVAAAWRVLHSPAFQLEYIQTINQDLRALLRHALASPAHVVKEAPSGQSLGKGRGNKAKTKGDTSLQGQLSDVSLAKFLIVYSDKLSSILQEPCAFAPSGLLELVQDRLAAVLGVDDQTQRPALLIEEGTVTSLREVYQLVQPVQDWTAYDVHKAVSHHGSGYIVPQD